MPFSIGARALTLKAITPCKNHRSGHARLVSEFVSLLTADTEANFRMQAIKCVVVGDG